ncbi:hypothetical protein TCAL_14625 [Tigriopus californicus]|uniref:Ionotropic glutamate receptor L-glutamate and glycine-binding domain-containing protein n=1 Tax=Tigriopus californicus TaxID=6832 RepID=A0A553P8B4_TIGCA|nr:hypothetical protein TCAL_14625 [Tigriopus californicus]
MDMEHLDRFYPEFQPNVRFLLGIANDLTTKSALKLVYLFKRLKIRQKSLEIRVNDEFTPVEPDLHRGFPVKVLGPNGIKYDLVLNSSIHLLDKDLRVTWLRIFPYVYKSPDLKVMGCDLQALKEMSKKHGFRFNLTQARYADVPSVTNSTEVGIIDGLRQGKFEVSISPLSYSPSRFENADFGDQIHSHVMGFIGTHPKPIDVFDTLFRPFEANVWACLLVVVIIYLGTLMLFPLKKYESWMMTFGPLMAESLPRTTLKLSLPWNIRNLMCLWLVGSFVIGMAYKSNLLANLSIISYQKQIQTPEEIYQSRYPVFTVKRTILESILRDSSVDLYRNIYNQNVKGHLLDGSFRSPEKDTLVPEGKAFEFHTWLQTFSMPDRSFLGQPVTQNAGAWNFPLNSYLTALLSRDLTKLKESGILDKWLNDILDGESKAGQNHRSKTSPSQNPLALRLIYPLMIAAGIGWFMGMIIFLVELCA